ncbi:MAG: hypothetical protein ACK5S2_04010 [Lysobacteraceae bacterium]|jgi:hypothetical protein|nr:hypothetical protein [Silanimonas sp.]
MPKQHCPVCQNSITPVARYPNYVCAECATLAESADGRLVEITNADIWGGIQLRYRDTGEPHEETQVFIRGIKCEAREARFGGVVIQALASDGRARPLPED